MATAYHLEALRRQRIIDKRAEAKRKLEEKVRESAKRKRSRRAEYRWAGLRLCYMRYSTAGKLCDSSL